MFVSLRRLGLLLSSMLWACGGTPASDDPYVPAGDQDQWAGDGMPPADAANCAPSYATPTSQSQPAALIVTSTVMANAFTALAELHTVHGVVTEVVTLATICQQSTCNDGNPAQDTAKAIKTYLAARTGLRYVILGGDIEVVPSRSVYDTYSNPFQPGYTFESDFYTDYYFADLSQWDSNGDGTYAEDGVDAPDYLPELAVARIPASIVGEVDAYVAKVEAHVQAYPVAQVGEGLLISDIAATYYIDIDSAWYFEDDGRTLDLMPSGFGVDKLYATALNPDSSAPRLTQALLESAFTTGYNLMVHNGHGSEGTAIYTPDGALTGTRAATLSNATRPILLSCACQAGAFNEPDQYLSTDSAGERLVLNPTGGAIAYLGNTTVGLGLAGGSQLIDEMLNYIQTTVAPRLGDALLAAHTLMPTADTFRVPYTSYDVPVVDQDSYEWTQKSAVLLGDPLLPVWTTALAAAPTITVTATPLCSGTHLRFNISPATTGTLRFLVGDSLYQVSVTGSAAEVDVRETASSLVAGLIASGKLYGYARLSW